MDGDNVLLEQLDDEDELSMLVEEVWKRSENRGRLALTRSLVSAWC
jgi:hypothetical protein